MILDNSIASVQMQVRGGWKNFAMVVSGYFVVIAGAVVSTSCYLEAPHLPPRMRNWSEGLLAIQVLLCVFVAMLRLSGAVRQDRTIGTIESHRLMPIDGGTVLFGYLLGGGFPFLSLFAINAIIGCATTGIGHSDMTRWLMANGILLSFSLFVWVLSVVAAMTGVAMNGLLVVVVIAVLISRGLILWLVPALTVLCTPMMGGTVFDLTPGAGVSGVGIGIAAQLSIAAILYVVAVRKFRRPDAVAFDIFLSMAMSLIWVIISIVGVISWATLRWPELDRMASADTRTVTQFIASVLCLMVLSCVTLSIPSSHHRQESLVHRFVHRSFLVGECACLVGLLLVIPIGDPPIMTAYAVPAIAASICLCLVEIASLVTMLSASPMYRFVFAMFICAMLWVPPMVVDTLIADSGETHWRFGMASPIGTMGAPWIQQQPMVKGLLVQGAVAAGSAGISLIVNLGRACRRAPKPQAIQT